MSQSNAKRSSKFKYNVDYASILSHLFWLCIMLLVVIILSIAQYMQFFSNEIPCPLCLLQRIGFFGIGFGAMLHFRNNATFRAVGITLLFVFILEMISIRQSLINIYPRPGHAWIGTSVFGIHMPVWSFIIS